MSPEQQVLLMLTKRLHAARKHQVPFVDFVMREELTRRPLRATPHQRILLKFVHDHPRCVLMLPVGHGKTFLMGACALFELGKDPTCRGAVLSATQGQAMKVLTLARSYIEQSVELHAVFPQLWPSQRRAEAWSTSALTVARPDGIRDPSLQAVGLEGAINGARLKLIIVDDVLTHENTNTRESRDKVCEYLDSSVMSRLDVANAKIVVTNTAWHEDDIAHRYMRAGWPTLRMEITGLIEICNADNWDATELRPSESGDLCRLAAYDDDSPLWPEKYSLSVIEKLRKSHLPHRFNQLYRNLCYNEATARCKMEWIEKCKKNARERGVYDFARNYTGPHLTVTGVDLAVQAGEANDKTAFFTFECMADGHRKVLDIEIGQWDGPTIVQKLLQKCRAFNSVVRVESNASQDFIRQFALAQDWSAPIKAHVTGRGKAHPEHGVEGLFIELHNGAWLLPNDPNGNVCGAMREFIDACLNYSPTRHTDDVMMACYFAREQAKSFGALSAQYSKNRDTSIASTIMSR